MLHFCVKLIFKCQFALGQIFLQAIMLRSTLFIILFYARKQIQNTVGRHHFVATNSLTVAYQMLLAKRERSIRCYWKLSGHIPNIDPPRADQGYCAGLFDYCSNLTGSMICTVHHLLGVVFDNLN